MSWGVGRRRGSDLTWPWLWLWPAAVAPIGPLAWEPPYAMDAALKSKKKKKKFRIIMDMIKFFLWFHLSILLST